MMLKGKRHGKFFADSRYGGKKKSLSVATAYRDSLLARRPKVKTGARTLIVVRGDARYLQIRIPTSNGSKTTEFSLRRHGPKKAKQLALDAYNAAVKRA
jgi:hypothetical protein